MKVTDIRMLVGNTPVVQFRSDEVPGARFWVKLEGCNPSGSVKDRACLYNINDALKTGRLRPGMTILDASSGNMACALAYFGRVLGHPVTVVCSTKLTQDKAAFIRYFGAELISKGDFTVEGNGLCREMAAAEPGKYCFMDQLHNWANPLASYEMTGPEIMADFPDLTAVVGALGSGGTMTGTCRFIHEQRPQAVCVAVEAASGTKIPGTGSFCDGDYVTPFMEKAKEEGLFDTHFHVHLADAQRRTRQAADQGIFAGWQTGGVLHAALEVAKARGLTGDIVAISGDSGWKNLEKLLNV